MSEIKSFSGDHFIIHISKDNRRLHNSKTKNHPYDLIISSKYAHAPMKKEELRGLADFIYQTIGENDGSV